MAAMPSSFAYANEELGFVFNEQLQNILSRELKLQYDGHSAKLDVEDYVFTRSRLEEKDEYFSEIENIHYCNESIQGLELCNITSTLDESGHFKKGASASINSEKIKEDIDKLTEDIKKEPQNGRFKMSEEGKLVVSQKSSVGYKLDVDQTVAEVILAIKDPKGSKVSMAIEEVRPEISTENISSLGIKELIAHGESNFRGSPKNRIHNIKVATERFNGVILKPGQEFSFTTLLGPVDEESGYKEELVIKENKTIPEFGGGVCQVSTTMFRAALNAGFEIIERRNHAYPVQYYSPQGTDATIYLPSPDLRFLNNTNSHALIQAKIEGTILSFDVYGTSDGREVELEGPQVTERTPDGGMKTVLYQNVKDENGIYILRDVFKSFYDNPDKYHEPEFTKKPKDWSNKQWDAYKKQHGL